MPSELSSPETRVQELKYLLTRPYPYSYCKRTGECYPLWAVTWSHVWPDIERGKLYCGIETHKTCPTCPCCLLYPQHSKSKT